jgi:Uma2 family endonuclease
MQSSIQLLSVIEYLEAEATSEIRHEYIDGQVFAMAGASRRHNRISGNIYSRLLAHLRGSGCDAFMADMKVGLKSAQKQKSIFYYPDVVITCNPDDQDQFIVNSPCLIIEVLSPGTEFVDCKEKLVNYQTITSLQEYILVSQDQMQVEVYRQDVAGNWTEEVLGRGNQLQLDSIDLILKMHDIYEDVFEV